MKNILLCGIFFLVTFLSACSNEELSKEEQVRQLVDIGVLAAENKKHVNIAELIDDKYSDQRSYNKQALIDMLRTYFFLHKNIHLFTKVDEISFQGENKAFLTLYVAMAGSVISDVSMLSSLRAQVYRFDLQLIKSDRWLISQAKWQRSSLKSMIKINPPTL